MNLKNKNFAILFTVEMDRQQHSLKTLRTKLDAPLAFTKHTDPIFKRKHVYKYRLHPKKENNTIFCV